MGNNLIVMLGSNVEDALQKIEIVKDLMQTHCRISSFSEILETIPCGKNYKQNFRNQAVRLNTEFDKDGLNFFFKSIENQLGRRPESKLTGIVPMDIDIIEWNGEIVHKDYERFDFVKKCVDQIRLF